MSQLKIIIFGNANELLIDKFSSEGSDWIMELCEEHKPYTDVEEVWYGEGFIPDVFTQRKTWEEFNNFFHEFGFNFSDKDEIQWFLNGELSPEPKIKGIYFDGDLIKPNLNQAHCNYTEIELPSLKKHEVFVYHGVVHIVSIDYILNIKNKISADRFNFHFINSGENGYMLKEIEYDGKPMERYYSGSDIRVNPGAYSLSPDNIAKIFSLVNTRKFLDVKFTK